MTKDLPRALISHVTPAAPRPQAMRLPSEVSNRLNGSPSHTVVANKASGSLGCLKRRTSRRRKGLISPDYVAFLRRLLRRRASCWYPLQGRYGDSRPREHKGRPQKRSGSHGPRGFTCLISSADWKRWEVTTPLWRGTAFKTLVASPEDR